MRTGQRLLDMVSTALRIPPPILRDEYSLDSSPLEHIVAKRLLILLESAFSSQTDPSAALQAVRKLVDGTSRAALPALRFPASDGIQLSAQVAGARTGKDAVILIGPCGLPTGVLQNWMEALADDRFVATCATRGFTADDIEFPDCSMDLERQARDLLALMDHLEIRRAHLMSICGGAVVALQLALLAADRVGSLSLWHGDFNVADERYRTPYQRDLHWLMVEAASSRERATELHPLVCDHDFVARVKDDEAHLILFPYSTPELLYRYARANSAIMLTDVKELARHIEQPTWLVTSELDNIAHPIASKVVASLIPRSELIESQGNHLTCLRAHDDARSVAARILRSAEPA